MLFAFVVAVLVAAIAVCAVVMIQALIARSREVDLERKRLVTELARLKGGVVTPLAVAEHLQITALDADRLLRSMVDDIHITFDYPYEHAR